ncbi:rod shape-determining protein RodA [Gracilibacillus oryzae]|uniref:Rod shape-determining protein RodA n=1 Tax=Gracilibacillus oryzae TaxID=1672701 RepID=A0A7C8L1M9_9BACI|nr:FtsW/RodA/SpoVE family cell cycle protein [Gracilibacillus oryzae]KAB8139094.1 rod shape-determining protein RodA [Gracilibacillus oryzae]
MSQDNKNSKIDYTLILIIIALAIISIFTLYTLNPYLIQKLGIVFYQKQIQWYIIGTVAIIVIMFFDYDRLRQVSWIFYGLGIIALTMLFFHFPPGIADSVNGAWGWFQIHGFGSLQPAEFMKVFLIIFLAHIIVAHNEKYPEHTLKMDFWLLAKIGMASIVPIFFLTQQPDLGGVLVLTAITVCMILVSGIKWRIILSIFGGLLITVVSIVIIYLTIPDQVNQFLIEKDLEHVGERFNAWLNPDENSQGDAYQLTRAMLAIGSGQLSGKGMSEFEVSYKIPEYQTDFIFTSIAEQFGFIGSSVVITIYFLLIYRLIHIALKCRDPFGSYMITGIIGMFAFQVFQNIGMSIQLLPITGLPLPFISYGGSSTLTYMLAIGIVLNIHYRLKTYMFDES